MRVILLIMLSAATMQAQLPVITDETLVKLIQGNVSWLTRLDTLKAYMNIGGGGDGNGIYSGDGTIPNGTNATVANDGTFRMDYFSGRPAITLNDLNGSLTLGGDTTTSSLQITPTLSSLSAVGGSSVLLNSGVARISGTYAEVYGGSNAGRLRFLEPSLGGNYTQFEAGPQSADITYIWPTTAGTPGQYMQYGSAGQLSWATDADESVTNEGQLSVGAGGANSSTINSNSSGSASVTIQGGSNVTVTEAGNTITIAASGGGGGGGSDGNGIYSGSDTIPAFTVATVEDNFSIAYENANSAIEIDDTGGELRLSDKTGNSQALISTDSIGLVTNKVTLVSDTFDISQVPVKIGFPSGGGSQTLTLNNDSLQISGGNFVELTTVGTNYVSGFNAFRNNTVGNDNYASGINALHWNSEGTNNYASGNGALYNNNTGTYNYASGNGALYNNNTGTNNYASGYNALYNNSEGDDNYASGKAALYSNTTGFYNQAIGLNALISNTSGYYNTAVGYRSIFNNQSGQENTAVGFQSGNFSGNLNNTVAIGSNSLPTQDNQIVLGNAQSTQLVTGNYKFKINQTVGSAQDGLVLRYDHSVGEIQLGTAPIPASIISPSQITSTQNNYSPSGWADATMVRISTSNFWGINGFSSVNVSNGEEKVLYNIGTFPFYIAGGHTGSIDSNRVDVGYDYIVNPKESVRLIYDNISNRWQILSQAVTSGFKTQTYHFSPGSSTSADWGNAGFAALSSGGFGIGGAVATLPACMNLSTGSAALTGAYIGFPKSINNAIRFQGAHLAIEGFVSLSALSVAADTFVAGIQIATLNANEILLQNNSISLIYSHYINGGNWSLVSRDNAGNNSSFVDTGIAVAANVGYHLRLEINDAGTEARAYINNNFAGLVSTNMPASSASAGGRAVIRKQFTGTGGDTFAVHSLNMYTVTP